MNQQIKSRIEQIKKGELPEGYKKTKVGIVPNEWEIKYLKQRFQRLTRKNTEGNKNVLTISAQYGLINQNDFFNKEVASEDKSNYYLLRNGEFAYNKSYSNGYPFGAIKKLTRYDSGVVSPLYICFNSIEENKCPEFYEHYFEGGYLNKEIQAFAQEGARNHGLLNISVDDFFNSYICVPSLPEQQKIAEILTAQDKVIELKEKLIAEKEAQKKYLMQNLLTGKKRLKGFSGEWKKVELGDIFEYLQPSKYLVSDTNYNDKFKTPVLTAGKTFILGYTNETKNIFTDVPVVIFDDFTTSSQYVNFPFKAKSSAMKILRCTAEYNILIAFQAMQQLSYVVGGHERHWISKFSQIPVSLPPLPEQNAIAEILSTADREIELLKAELAEQKQKKKALMQLLLTGIVRV